MKKKTFNLNVGTEVDYHSTIGGPVTSSGHIVRAIERTNGRWVAFISGRSGYVAVEALSEPEPPPVKPTN